MITDKRIEYLKALPKTSDTLFFRTAACFPDIQTTALSVIPYVFSKPLEHP